MFKSESAGDVSRSGAAFWARRQAGLRGIGLWLALLVGIAGCDVFFKPEMPVQTTLRASVVGEGAVVQLHNESDRRLVLQAEITADDGAEPKELTVSLGPNEAGELGWLEGHAFQSGDVLTLRHDDFRAHSTEIP